MGKKVSNKGEEKLSAKDFAERVVKSMGDYMDSPEYLKNEVSALRSTMNVQLGSINAASSNITTIKQEMMDPMYGTRLWDGITKRDQTTHDQLKYEEIDPLKEKIEEQAKLIDRLLDLVEKQSKQIEIIAKKADQTEDDLKILQTLVASSVFSRGTTTPSNPITTNPYFGTTPTLSSTNNIKPCRNGKSGLFESLKEEYSNDMA